MLSCSLGAIMQNKTWLVLISKFLFIQCQRGILGGAGTSRVDDCTLHSAELSEIYHNHFRITNQIVLKVILEDEKVTYMMQDFLHAFWTRSSFRRKNTVIIKYTKADTNGSRKMKLAKVFGEDYLTTYNKKEVLTQRGLDSVKLDTSDVQNGNIIISWDHKGLLNSLETDPTFLIANPRSLYAILFISPYHGSELSWKRIAGNILSKMWKEFGVLNVITQNMCSREHSSIFVYNPFHRNNLKNWGHLKKFSISELQNKEYLIYNTLDDLEQYPLNISLFIRVPTVVPVVPKLMLWDPLYQNLSASGGFGGQDAMLLGNLATYLNFKVNIVPNLDNDNFGFVLPNGTYTGSLADVARRRADLAANGRFLSSSYPQTEYSAPFSNDKICIVVPKAKRIPDFTAIFRCFSWGSWLAILASLVFYMVFLDVTKIIQEYIYNQTDYRNYVWLVYGTFVSASVNVQAITQFQRKFFGTWLAYCLIIVGVYQGTLFESLSTISYYRDIDTLEDLDQSGLQIASSLDIFEGEATETVAHLREKRIDIPGNSLKLVASTRQYAALERHTDANLFLRTIYVNKDGSPLLHIMKECPISYFVALLLPKGSPYLLKFNVVINKFFENGLINKWYRDMSIGLITEKESQFHGVEEVQRPLDPEDLQTAFYFLSIGLGLASLCFIVEIYLHRRRRNGHIVPFIM